MLDLLLIGSHSLTDESGRIANVVESCGMSAQEIKFVSSQDTRAATELIEHRTAMKGYRVECLLHYDDERQRLEALLGDGVRYLAMTTRYFRNLYEFCDIIQHVRKVSPDTSIILGGGFFRSAWSKLESGERRHFARAVASGLLSLSRLLPRAGATNCGGRRRRAAAAGYSRSDLAGGWGLPHEYQGSDAAGRDRSARLGGKP